MTSTMTVVAIDATEPRRVADFWAAALGWQVTEEDGTDVSIGPPGGGWPSIDVLAVPDAKSNKNRLHFDLRANGTTTQDEIERLIGLGARRADVGQRSDSTWTVLADPEDNEFCVLDRTVQDLS